MEPTENETILVVDDDPLLLRAQSRVLEKQGYTVLQASDAEEGLEMVRRHSPDLVLHDVLLPGIDGLEACRRIKAESQGTFVVLMSSMKTSSEHQADGLDSGADGYIPRPVSNRELAARVRSLLRIKRAETALRRSEHRYRSIIENAGLGIVVLDRAGVVVSANPAFCEMTGFERRELVGASAPYPFWPETGVEEERARLQRLLRRGRTHWETWRRRKDGTLFPASTTASAVTDENGVAEFFIDVVQDVTDKKRAEEAAMRVKKMEAIGSMVGGMAHDLNNLLSVILGNIDLSQMEADLDAELYENLAEARKACILTRDLISRYLSFSGDEPSERNPGDLGEVASEAAAAFSSETRAEIEVSASDSLWPAKFDRHQLGKALEGMIENAVEAAGANGEVRIRVENADLTGENAEPGLAEGRYVRIVVRDSGPGIPEEHLPRIFDPYFSTKERGGQKGMGFGLATVYAVVANHDGDIRASSPPEGGARFDVCIPAYRPDSDP